MKMKLGKNCEVKASWKIELLIYLASSPYSKYVHGRQQGCILSNLHLASMLIKSLKFEDE